ncbi:MAG: hypothetical protein GC180_02755 [Bacteroidetes bacterium]|nr:hypothetical protein [Bacteroidota bacterium]
MKQKLRKLEGTGNYKGVAILRYTFKDQAYFLIPPSTTSADMYTVLYNENCEYICAPGGGISGKGSGICPDLNKAKVDTVYKMK